MAKKKTKVSTKRKTGSSWYDNEEHHAFLLILAGGLVVIFCLYFLGVLNMHSMKPNYQSFDQMMQQPATSSGTMQEVTPSPSTSQTGY